MSETNLKKVAKSFHEIGELLSGDPQLKSARHNRSGPVSAKAKVKVNKIEHSRASKHGIGNIELKRPIQIRCWRVIGQIAKASKRNELIPVLLRAREMGSTDAADIASHLLFESASRRIVAQRLLQISENYGLLEQRERRHFLTETGQIALDKELIFVPESGTWTIWASDDPLLSTPILHVAPWKEPTASDEVWNKNGENKELRKFEKLPQWLKKAVGVVATPVVGKGAELRIDHLDPKGCIADSEASLTATWDASTSRLRVQGKLNGIDVKTAVSAPDITLNQVWKQLLESEWLWSQWDQNVSALRVSFDDTEVGERESFMRAVKFSKPNIDGVGCFDALTLEGVPIHAYSSQDATLWAEWRLAARINTYATVEQFSNWTDEAVDPLSEFQPSTSTRKALADAEWQARGNRPTTNTWHLVAAEDWGL